MQVANRAPAKGTPALCSTDGFTTMMYAIVRNVVMPASISMRGVLPRAVRWNRRSRRPADAPLSEPEPEPSEAEPEPEPVRCDACLDGVGTVVPVSDAGVDSGGVC